MYRVLKRARVILSVLFIIMLTWAIIDTEFGLTRLGGWLMHVQIIPAILSGAVLWIVLWMLITLTFGRVYCSTVCPLGTMQDVAGRLGRLTGRRSQRRYSYSAPVNSLRYSVPLIVAACLFLGITAVVEASDPYSVYRRMVLAVTRPIAISTASVACAMLLLVIISFVAWRRGRILCNTICPAGGLLGLLGRQPIYRVDINTDKCIHCGKCEDVCKASCIDLKDCVVDCSRCVMCMNCTSVCPNDAITVRRGRHQLSLPMMQPTVNTPSANIKTPDP